jgi:hypothetical protein
MDQDSITKAAVKWKPPKGKENHGEKIDLIQIMKEDMKTGAKWEQILDTAVYRKASKGLTALCITGM